MKRIASFEKVSQKQFFKDVENLFNDNKPCEYDDICIPKRATSGSAGYDFYSTVDFSLEKGESVIIPTGIRVKMNDGWVLMIYPRSGLGFKFRMQLDNTVGIIDGDYYFAENEGHILIKISNNSNEEKKINIQKGSAFAQGVFIQYGITENDNISTVRKGGFGSTDNV